MSAYHHRLLVDEFRQHGGTLTSAQVAAVVGFGWRRDLHEMRLAKYLVIEDPTDLWHLDLEALPEPEPVDAADSRTAWEGDDSSPGTEGEPQPLPLDVEQPRPASPYDPSVEAA